MEYLNELSGGVIAAAIDVHRALGPGLLESAYHRCLEHELALRGIAFESQKRVPVLYKGVEVDCAFQPDFVIDDQLVVELKAVESLSTLHTAQVLTYLRVGGWRLGLLLNFNVPVLRSGIRRVILSCDNVKP